MLSPNIFRCRPGQLIRSCGQTSVLRRTGLTVAGDGNRPLLLQDLRYQGMLSDDKGELPPFETAFFVFQRRLLNLKYAALQVACDIIYSTMSQRRFLACDLFPDRGLGTALSPLLAFGIVTDDWYP